VYKTVEILKKFSKNAENGSFFIVSFLLVLYNHRRKFGESSWLVKKSGFKIQNMSGFAKKYSGG